ncbi:MAG: AfsR/SARP family transcriptional regulator, partial [Gordonibacter urolithinfaciens]
PPLRAAEALALHRAEMELFSQRRAFERSARESAERRAERAATHPDAYLDGRYLPEEGRAPSLVPLLTVNLFGGLDVRIGDTPVDPGRFRRQKVKTLLALLVLNRGREFPRDRLVGIMWPESEVDSARKNFYSVWSHLRRALSGPSGACPYLVRQQNGCRLDERLIVTDVARFDAVCRMLLFGQPGADGWAQLYAEIDEAFADDLMPSEQDNEFVMQARKDRRMQLVDALVAAAERLVAADDAQEGLWFARAALRRDRTREDAYTALMRAQIAAGQRTAALETYFECRRFLTTELGIDPSLATMELYRSIIETEEPLD